MEVISSKRSHSSSNELKSDPLLHDGFSGSENHKLANAINRSINNQPVVPPNIEDIKYVDCGGKVNVTPVNFFANKREQASSWTGVTTSNAIKKSSPEYEALDAKQSTSSEKETMAYRQTIAKMKDVKISNTPKRIDS